MKTNNYTRFLVPSFQWRWLCSLLILLGFSITVTRAQLAVNYPLTISSGTYSSISGTGTLVSAMAADTYHENVTGLTGFTVNGVTYNNVRMSSNGWLVLYGATAPTTTTTTPLSTAITNGGVALAPFAADLTLSSGGGCAFYRQDTGTELVFEWMNYSRYSFSGSNDVLNFQVRLNYSTGVISFVYGTCTAGSNPTSSPQVGWKTTPTTATNWATDVNNLMIDIIGSPNTCSWADAVNGNAQASSMYIRNTNPTVGPTSGLTYTWTPQSTPAPVRTFAAPASITGSGATVSWTAPSGAAQYNVQYRTVGSCSWTNWSGNPTTSAIAALTGLNAGTSYQVRVQAQTTGGAASSIWSHVPGTTAGAGVNGYTATGTFTTTFPCAGTPTALGSNTITTTTANISWTAASPAPSNGYEYYVSTVNTAPTYGTTATGSVGAGITTASLSSLPMVTQHYFWVRTDCGAGDKGAWSASANFTTQGLTTAPWVEGFTTATLPSGWSNSSFTTPTTINATITTGTTTNYIYKNLYSGGTTGNFSTINVGPLAGNESLSFVYRLANFSSPYAPPAAASGNFVVAVSTDYGATYTDLETVSNNAVAGWQPKTYSLASYAGQNVRVRITGNWTSGDYYLAFDNFVIASCLQPSGLTASNLTPSSLDLSWSAPSPAPGFGYEYVLDNSPSSPSNAANTGTDVAGTSLTGVSVTANTTYYLHVRSECTDGGDYSSWVNSAAFTTPCNPSSIPYSQGFESGFTQATPVANCISQESVTGTEVWRANTSLTDYNRTPRTGSWNAYLQYSNNDWMFIPVTLVGSQSYDVSFFARQDGATAANASVRASYGTVGTAAGMTNSIIASTGIINGDYQGFAGSFTPPSSGTYYVGINGTINGSPWYISIDDILIEETPACPKPTALSATPALDSASLNWTDAGPATGWEIEYGEVPFTPTGTANVLGISAHPYNLTGLDGQTTYSYYVRGDCDVDGFSVWAGPFTFTTLPCIPTYTNGKTDGDLLSSVKVIGTTLDNNSGTDEVNPSYTFFTGQPQYTGTLNAGTTYDVEVSIGTWGNQGVAVWVDFDGDGLFETPSERIGYTTGTFGVGTGSLPIDPANTTTFPISLPCDPTPGSYRMRVRDVYNTGGQLIDPCNNYGYGETEDYIITIAPPPPCPSVALANVQSVNHNSVTLDWNIGCAETQWDVHVVTTGGGLTGAPNHGGITSHPTTITGLSASTAYQYYVRADCGGSQSAWVGPYSFTTLATPPANDDCVNAIAFGTILPDQNCVTVTANTVGATGSADATCFGTEDDDVWYTFTVPSGYSSLLYTNTTITGSTDRMLQVLDACGGTSLGCYDPETGTLTGLTGGNTYYLRAYTYGTGVTSSFSICLRTPPPPPANDDCVNAIAFPTIPTNSNCASVTANTGGATGSADATCFGTEDDDVWYTFTVPVGYTSLLYSNSNISGSTDRMLQVLDACGGTSLGCYDPESGTITGLTGGSTYRLRAYTYGTGVVSSFSICLRVPPPPPANDDCINAVALTVNPSYTCSSSATGTTLSATASSETAPTCAATGANDDVWYKFTATGANHRLTMTSSSDMVMAVYSGSCGSLVSVACSDPNTLDLTGLTPLEEYHVRVYTYSSTVSVQATSFTICVGTPPPPPSNDECAGAIALTVGVSQNAYTNGATQSESSFLCDGFTGNPDDDVWFSFVAPAYPVNISVAGNPFDGVIDLREGSCGSTFSIDCSDDGINSEVLEEPTLVPGQTYYVRVFTWGGPTAAGSFSIVINSALPAINNEPGANTPNVNSANAVYPNCSAVSGTTVGSTSSYDDNYNDVWYRFNAISNGVSVKMTSNYCDNAITLYSSNFTELSHEDLAGEGEQEIMNYGGLTPGQDYYLAISNNTDNGTDGPFILCVQKLRAPLCAQSSTPYTLCSSFKSTVTGATNTNFSFEQTGPSAGPTTNVSSAGPITLGNATLALMYGYTYNVSLTANYIIANGAGTNETISVTTTDACPITLQNHPSIEVKLNQRCSQGATLYRSSYLLATSAGTVCGITGYNVEFTPVTNCAGAGANPLETFVKSISSPAASISLNYAFNQIPLVGNSGIGYWSVRWQPKFGSKLGNWSTTPHVIAVNGTAPAGMLEEPGDDMNGLENTGNAVAANLYPNPNNGEMVNLNMTGITSDNVFVRIMDGMGRVVYTNRYTVDGSLNTIVTFSKPLASGLYMVEFTTGNDVITQRMMVTK